MNENFNQISSLTAGQEHVNILATVVKKDRPVMVYKNRHRLRFCQALVDDASGRIYLKLWNEVIEKVNVGDVLCIKNAYVSEREGFKKITLGKNGVISIFAMAEEVRSRGDRNG